MVAREKWEPVAYKLSKICEKNGQKFNIVPLLYIGEFINWYNVQRFIGVTKVGASPHGEGVVVKSQDRLARLPHVKRMVKLVHENFSEVKRQKVVDTVGIEKAIETASVIVTERRVEKAIYKLVDNGELRYDWNPTDFKDLVKVIPKNVYFDCLKEESKYITDNENTFEPAGGFKKACSKLAIDHLKKILNSRGK